MIEGEPSSEHEYRANPALHNAYMQGYNAGWSIGSVIMHHEAGRQIAQERHARIAEYYQKLQERYRATHDPLTGLLNVAGLEEAVERLGPDMNNVSVVYVDIKDQKAVNDVLGHDEGDRVIMAVAGLLRDDDIAARIGGDEFLVINMPNRDTDASGRRGESLSPLERGLATRNRILKDMEQVLANHPEAARLGLQVSVGFAIGRAGLTIKKLRTEAEAAMMRHKKTQQQATGQYRPRPIPSQRPASDQRADARTDGFDWGVQIRH